MKYMPDCVSNVPFLEEINSKTETLHQDPYVPSHCVPFAE